MADSTPNTDQVTDVPGVDQMPEDPNNYSLDQILRMIRLERTQGLNKQYKNALNKLRMGQLKVSILTDLRRYINLSKDKDGKFDASNQEFQDLITKSKAKYDKLSDELVKAGESTETMETFGDLIEEVGIVEGKDKYSADESKAVLDSIKMTTDQLSPLNEMHMQTVTRVEGEINETYQMLMAAYKPLHNVVTMMARAIKGG